MMVHPIVKVLIVNYGEMCLGSIDILSIIGEFLGKKGIKIKW